MKLNTIDENGPSPPEEKSGPPSLKTVRGREDDPRRTTGRPGLYRGGPKMRTFMHMLTAIGLLALAVHAPPAAALVIGAQGWTADTPAGVTYGGLVGGIGPGNGGSGVLAGGTGSYTFEIQLASAVGVPTTIHFVNTVDATAESYFRLSFKGTNNGTLPWTGLKVVITDVTTDPIPVEGADVAHPERAHIHRNLWTAGAFSCADSYCLSDGRYDMFLALAAPLTTGNSAMGSTLRLHDLNETGTDPMKFNLTLTPVPEPDAFILFGCGLAGLIGVARSRRATVQPGKSGDGFIVA